MSQINLRSHCIRPYHSVIEGLINT
jgi:hypothetical protein